MLQQDTLYTGLPAGAIICRDVGSVSGMLHQMRTTVMQNSTKGEPFERFFSELALPERSSLEGCTGALAAICLAGLAQQPGVTLFVCADAERAKNLEKQVSTWLGSRSGRVICMLPERASIYDQTAADPDVMCRRLAAMAAEMNSGALVIAPLSVVLERFFSPERWLSACFEIRSDVDVSRDELINRLIQAGYTRTSVVEERGTFAVRGSLLDLFPPDAEFPARLDFFGDGLESIKLFVPTTQRSFDKRDRLTVIPVNEFVADDSDMQKLSARVAE